MYIGCFEDRTSCLYIDSCQVVLIDKHEGKKAYSALTTECVETIYVVYSGILTLKILKEFEAHYVEGIFTADDFLSVLEKLLIVSQLLPNSEYFFPAILSMTAEAQIGRYLSSLRAANTAALVVQFFTGWAPPGVYCCSVCHLQSHALWEVADRPLTTEDIQTPHVSRNSITFTKRGRPGSV